MCFSGNSQNNNSLSPTVGISAAIVDSYDHLSIQDARCFCVCGMFSIALFFGTVPTANTLVRWVSENARVSEVQTQPCPTFGRVALVSWPACSVTPVLSSRPPTLTRKPPSVLSPFARCRCYRQRGYVCRLLREHYFSVIALTDLCAKPIWLSLPSAFRLVLGVLAGCFQPLLPVGSSRRYSENLS
jgi:hypothetical protein